MKNWICIYSRPPIPGRTKTRLAAVIGEKAAAELARAMLLDVYTAASQTPDAALCLWYPPDSCPAEFDGLPLNKDIFWCKQQGKDLGERMSHTFATVFEKLSAERVIVIGSDCITHSAESLSSAFTALDNHKIVLQPAVDGGYVLIGQASWLPQIFRGVPWGTHRVMEVSRQCLTHYKISYWELPATFDVDVFEDLEKVKIFLESNQRIHTKEIVSYLTSKPTE